MSTNLMTSADICETHGGQITVRRVLTGPVTINCCTCISSAGRALALEVNRQGEALGFHGMGKALALVDGKQVLDKDRVA